MPQVTYSEAASALRQAGFRGIQIPVMIAIGLAESGLNTDTVGDNGQSFGIWQIYQPVWSSRFNATCASDLQCSANAAWEISNHGADYNPWSVYRFSKWGRDYETDYSNPFTKYLPDVLKAFSYPVSSDINQALRDVYTGVIDGIDPDGSGGIVGGIIDTGNDIIDTVTDPFGSLKSLLPTMPDIKAAIVTVVLLLFGLIFVAFGTYGLVYQSETGQRVMNDAKKAATMAATKGAVSV